MPSIRPAICIICRLRKEARMNQMAERLRELEDRGYTILEDTLSRSAVDRLKEELERLYARQAELTGRPWGPERGLENLTNKSPLFLDVLESTRSVIELMEATLG